MRKNVFKYCSSAALLAGCLFLGVRCYSFKGVSIDAETKTFSVTPFSLSSPAAPATIGTIFSEKLKDKIRTNTRLTYANNEAHLQFSGTVTEFTVISQTPQPGQQAAFNQLKITVAVEMTNLLKEKNSWKQSFSFQTDFPGSASLLSVQDGLITTISNKIVEDIFNKAFTENW